MKHIHNVIRIFTGLLFLVIAFSKFGFLPSAVNMEHMFTPEGWAFIKAVQANGYLFPTIGVISLACGLAFLTKRYVAIAAVILVPITVNFALFHIFLGFPINSTFTLFREIPSFIPLALNVYMLYTQRKKYNILLKSQ